MADWRMRQSIVPVQYTVTSRGRPIGITDLAYARFDDSRRAGWFFPTGLTSEAAEAFEWDGDVELRLRRPDGSVVPTEWIGIRDTVRLLARYPIDDERWDIDEDPELLVVDEWWNDQTDWTPDDDEAWNELCDWVPEGEEVEFPRYQIFVLLAVPGAIP